MLKRGLYSSQVCISTHDPTNFKEDIFPQCLLCVRLWLVSLQRLSPQQTSLISLYLPTHQEIAMEKVTIQFVPYATFHDQLMGYNAENLVDVDNDPLFCVHISDTEGHRCSQSLNRETIAELKKAWSIVNSLTVDINIIARTSLCANHIEEYYETLCLHWNMERTPQNDKLDPGTGENPIEITDGQAIEAENNTETNEGSVDSTRIMIQNKKRKAENSTSENTRQNNKRHGLKAKSDNNRLTPSKADQNLRSELMKPLFEKRDRTQAFVYILIKRAPVTDVNDIDGEESGSITPLSITSKRNPMSRKTSGQRSPAVSTDRVQAVGSTTIGRRESPLRHRARKASSTSISSISLNQQVEQSNGYADIDSTVLFKVGFTADLSKRSSQIESGCSIEVGEIWKTGRLERWEAARVERYVKKELGCWQKDVDCGSCNVVHKEWFEVSQKTMVDTVHRWEMFMKQKPFDEWTGDVTEFWKDRIDGHPSDFEKINDETDEERHQRWTAAINPRWVNWLRMIYCKYQVQRHWIAFIYCFVLPVHLMVSHGGMVYKAYLVSVLVLFLTILKPRICAW
jgi:T5orf172 domain